MGFDWNSGKARALYEFLIAVNVVMDFLIVFILFDWKYIISLALFTIVLIRVVLKKDGLVDIVLMLFAILSLLILGIILPYWW